MRTLIINNSNVVQGYNNSKYTYQFSGGGANFEKGDQIAVQSLQIPYSWFNITSAYNNNTFGYMLNGLQYNVNITDGFYTIDDLNNLLKASFLSNGLYLLDNTGGYVFYGQLSTNVSLYGIQFDALVIPTSLPTGYTNPKNVLFNTVVISSPTCFQLVIPSTNIVNLLGFNAGSYPATPQSTVYSCISNSTPNLTPVNSVILRCSIVSNNGVNPSDAFYSFSPNIGFGSNILVSPSVVGWISCKEGTFSHLDIQLVDQNFIPMSLKDSNICIQLLIKSKDER